MIDTTFTHNLRQRLAAPLPGLDVQVRMAPIPRKQDLRFFNVPADARQSAVLVLFYPGAKGITFPLILRNTYAGVHSAQISFPGGRFEESDADLLATALREAHEEVGVPPHEVEVLGPMTSIYIPPSNFLVQPYVGVAHVRPNFVPDPTEVAAIIEAPLAPFQSGEIRGESTIAHRTGTDMVVPSFTVDGHVVWGATAMMLSELVAITESLD